jgi:hypothetical protein
MLLTNVLTLACVAVKALAGSANLLSGVLGALTDSNAGHSCQISVGQACTWLGEGCAGCESECVVSADSSDVLATARGALHARLACERLASLILHGAEQPHKLEVPYRG